MEALDAELWKSASGEGQFAAIRDRRSAAVPGQSQPGREHLQASGYIPCCVSASPPASLPFSVADIHTIHNRLEREYEQSQPAPIKPQAIHQSQPVIKPNFSLKVNLAPHHNPRPASGPGHRPGNVGCLPAEISISPTWCTGRLSLSLPVRLVSCCAVYPLGCWRHCRNGGRCVAGGDLAGFFPDWLSLLVTCVSF